MKIIKRDANSLEITKAKSNEKRLLESEIHLLNKFGFADLTIEDITKIARLDLRKETSELQILRDKLLLSHFTKLGWFTCMSITGQEIKENYLVIENAQIPDSTGILLHPIFILLFKSYNNKMPVIPADTVEARQNVTNLTREIVRKAGITQLLRNPSRPISLLFNRPIPKYTIVAPYTFANSTRSNMVEAGISTHCFYAMTGQLSTIGRTYVSAVDIGNAFSSRFYEPLHHLQLGFKRSY